MPDEPKLVIDTEHRDAPICPYCGHARTDAWEINFGPGMEGEAEIDCAHCEREYIVARNVTVTYCTSKIDEPSPPPDNSNRTWQDWPDECPHCGAGAEVFTVSGKPNAASDGDEARCKDCHCPGVICITDPDEDSAGNYIDWHDEPNCQCEWCKAHPEPQ